MNYIIICSREYRYATIQVVQDLITEVSTGILAYPLKFTAPPFTKLEADAVVSEFISCKNAFHNGGKAQEPAWNKAFADGIQFLDKTADYVDGVAKGDADTITLSGHKPIHVHGRVPAQIPGEVMVITHIKESSRGQIIVESELMGDNVHYGCIMVQGMALPAGFSIDDKGLIIFPPCTAKIYHSVSNQKKKSFTGLVTGVDYYIYFYVVNAAGAGPVSTALIVNCG